LQAQEGAKRPSERPSGDADMADGDPLAAHGRKARMPGVGISFQLGPATPQRGRAQAVTFEITSDRCIGGGRSNNREGG
jgi:hypothetical protein